MKNLNFTTYERPEDTATIRTDGTISFELKTYLGVRERGIYEKIFRSFTFNFEEEKKHIGLHFQEERPDGLKLLPLPKGSWHKAINVKQCLEFFGIKHDLTKTYKVMPSHNFQHEWYVIDLNRTIRTH